MGVDFASAIEPTPYRISSGMDIIKTGDALQGLTEALQKNDVARILAEPSIVTLSGRPASFHVGGQMPLPAPPGSKQPIEFRPFGTQVDVVAKAVGNNRVRLDLRVEVSEPLDAHAITVGGTRVSALRVRRCDTPIELEFGQTGVLTGMVERSRVAAQKETGTPANENEIELLFLVTPETVPALASAANGSAR